MPKPEKPRDEADVVEAVGQALAEATTLEIVGHASKRSIGRAAQMDRTLDLSGLTGIVLYEPDELVLTARAGTPIGDIERLLADHRQVLAFEPPDFGALLGGPSGQGTLGGVLAAGLSGPRRIKAGAARDFALGVRAVSGRGESFKAGGRVVKNVTGYDLPKLVCGSWGTLAAVTELTLKVMPMAEDTATVLLFGLEDGRALAALVEVMRSIADPSGAVHLPQLAAGQMPLRPIATAGRSVTAVRLEGIAPSVADRREKLEALLRPWAQLGHLDGADSIRFWSAVRDVQPFAREPSRALWRISIAPSRAASAAERIAAATGAVLFYDWCGGLLWAEMPGPDPQEPALRAATADDGAALLFRADPSYRTGAVFPPLAPALLSLSERVKASFDPNRILNPARMYAGL